MATTDTDTTLQEKLTQSIGTIINNNTITNAGVISIATGRATIEEYADEIALMNEYANKVNKIQAKIDALEETTEEKA